LEHGVDRTLGSGS